MSTKRGLELQHKNGPPLVLVSELGSNSTSPGSYFLYHEVSMFHSLTPVCPSVYLMKEVILYAPVNTNNDINGGYLLFSDGHLIQVGALSPSGSVVSLGTAGIYASAVRFYVSAVSSTTTAAGLAEIQIYNAV